MLELIFSSGNTALIRMLGFIFAFAATFITLSRCQNILPRDQGRAYAVNGALSAGKPRGAGLLFVLVFAAAGLIFGRFSAENLIYIVMTVLAMITGYLDDASKSPWNEYKKGLLDLIIAIVVSVTYYHFNSSTVHFYIVDKYVTIPAVLFIILSVILIWVSINVTNCSDGVDGLSATLSVITLLSFMIFGGSGNFNSLSIIFITCLVAYLWFNSTPSILMMGDAGSRAMGLFIAMAALKSGSPFVYIPFALVLILDGGLGLIKVSLLRFLKIKILTNVRTPLHDHVRKVKEWSNTQTVYRFAIIQIFVCVIFLYLRYL